jgi:hypothetical protein
MIHIDHHKAIEALRECVEERGPDFVYKDPVEGVKAQSCFYWHYPVVPDAWAGSFQDREQPAVEPGCMIGLMLHKLGVPAEATRTYEEQAVFTMWDRPNGVFELTENAMEVCRAAQNRQDDGDRWGDALACAEEKYQEVSNRG